MKKLLPILAAFLIVSDANAAGAPGSPTGAVTSAETADLVSGSTTISAQCATPASGCSAGQWVPLKLGGRSSVAGVISTSNFSGTLACYFSKDNRATWFTGLIRNSTVDYPNTSSGYTTTIVLAANTATTTIACLSTYGGSTDVALVSTAAVTNTLTAVLTASNTQASLLNTLISIRGQQAIGGGLSVQEIKDAGRTFVVLGADGVTPAISDTLITFSKNVGGTVTATQTTYAITSGKTLRLQSLCASLTAGAAANIARVRLRLNTAGACLAGSGLLLPALELAPQYGTAAASEGWAAGCVPIPDGLELTGASWNICLSESAVAASGTLTVNLIGYEY
jgi:hypothetical protein